MILDGKSLSDKIADDLSARIAAHAGAIRLAIILVGDDPASIMYVNAKQERASSVGIDCDVVRLPATTPESKVIEIIARLNADAATHGIMVQLPLPSQISARNVTRAIAPLKDVDGLNPASDFVPATVRGIEKLLEHYLYGANFDLSGRSAVVVGCSQIVGRPAAKMLLDHNATVTICHVKTMGLADYTIRADIIVSATGVADLIRPEMIRDGVVLIDAGVPGDVDPACYPFASAYTTHTGGVGPMTVISLMENTVRAASQQLTIKN